MDSPVSTLPESTDPTTKPASTVEQRGDHNVDPSAPNIVICGKPDVDKSSIINLISGEGLAPTSNNAQGDTSQYQRYAVSSNGMSCAIWDITGLDEGIEGTVSAMPAESNLKEWMRRLARSEGIHLIIYCIRATRFTASLKRNYDLLYVKVGRRKVPVALVVTGLEYQQGGMETWWVANEAALLRRGMQFDAHACVTTSDVNGHDIQQRRLQSQTLLRELVVRYTNLPARKIVSSSVLCRLRTALRRMTAAGRTKMSAIIRRVINRDTVTPAETGLTI